MSLLALMVALCIFLSFRQRIQSYLIKKNNASIPEKETINTNTSSITYSEYNSTFFLAQETPADEKKRYLSFFPQRAPLPSSQDSHGTFPHLPPCWYCNADFLFDFLFVFHFFFCYCYCIADCNSWLILPHYRPLLDFHRTHPGLF